MNKILLIALSLMVQLYTVNAQLSVDQYGKVNIQRDSLAGNASLNVGNNVSGMLSLNNMSYKAGIRSYNNNPVLGNSIAIYGEARQQVPSSDYFSVGVWGMGGGGVSGRNYGVLASLHTGEPGAAIYATNKDNTYFHLGGNYSGYFYGPTYIEGMVYTTQGVSTVSDIRLKEEIRPVSETEPERGSTLENLTGMEVLEYYVKSPREKVLEMEGEQTDMEGTDKTRHFGLSAQEVQKYYPNLVSEVENGYLSLNYVELVPLLIRSIQELKQELDLLKGEKSTGKLHPLTSGLESAMGKKSMLFQNIPNPFREKTIIRFQLADDVREASICIFDMSGKLLKKLPVSPGMESVSVNGYELGEGMFLYSLVANGVEIDTKRMILSK